MLKVLYEDQELLVAVKPAGMESQAARRFEPDMVSAIRNYLVMNKSCTPGQAPYVGVIHRLDKPVSGVMVYAKTKNAAAALSSQLQKHQMKKVYEAVVCGKPVNSVENLVDIVENPWITHSDREKNQKFQSKALFSGYQQNTMNEFTII